jgi:pyrroloquinoline-quinone synthase
LILAKASDPGFRRSWVRRIHDHDGEREGQGGLALWLALADAAGLDRAEVESCANVLPGVREACDAYVHFVESHDLLESVAASLTELFAGDIMTTRIAAFEKHYPWVDAEGLRYFQNRTRQAPRDAAEGLRFVLDGAQSDADRDRCVAALERKCEILWLLLDAIESAHAVPVPSPHAQIRADEADGAMLVVLPERAVQLNDSGREIFDLCDGARSAEEIARELRRRHPEIEGVEDDVHVFLTEMRGLGVLTVGRGS